MKRYTRKAKGFSKVNVKGRMSRTQTKQINDAYNDIIKNLSSSHKEKVTETISKFQKSFRHKLKEKKSKSKKVPKYKSSKYFKTLQEIPKPITDKILTSIGEKYELADNTVGLMVSNTIELFKLEGKMVSILEMIKEVYSKLLFHIIKWIYYVDHIRALQRPDSSDEDEEIPDWVENQIFKIRTIDMPKTGKWDVDFAQRIDPALVAFAVWDGVKEDRNGRKVISVWQRFNIKKPKS